MVVDVAERRQIIRKALDAATRTVAGARWREDEALLETVVHLTEWPTVILGDFEPEYLELPEEVLVTVMRDHQKYFAVEDAKGKLAPHFLAVLNTQADEEGAAIIRHGNARVLRARFKDARFFWDVDQKTPLAERVESLKHVTFQKELGSYAWKTEQNLAVANALATTLGGAEVAFDEAALFKAVELAKTDLTTELVKEFTELQGVIGGLYARAQGLGETGCAGDLRAVHAGFYRRRNPGLSRRAVARSCRPHSDHRCDVRDRQRADGVEGPVCAAARGQCHRKDSGRVGVAAYAGRFAERTVPEEIHRKRR